MYAYKKACTSILTNFQSHINYCKACVMHTFHTHIHTITCKQTHCQAFNPPFGTCTYTFVHTRTLTLTRLLEKGVGVWEDNVYMYQAMPGNGHTSGHTGIHAHTLVHTDVAQAKMSSVKLTPHSLTPRHI